MRNVDGTNGRQFFGGRISYTIHEHKAIPGRLTGKRWLLVTVGRRAVRYLMIPIPNWFARSSAAKVN